MQVLVSAVNVIRRPKSSPASLLAFYISALVVHLLLVIDARNASQYVAMSAAIFSILVILMMPLRDPSLPSSDISRVGDIPTSQLRSPEDNLRLWEFLSISWMAPMISVGKKRQLQEDDVWALGFEFQHKRLHETFRQLKGSFIRRLLRANGIDISIIIGTATVETICGMYSHMRNRHSMLIKSCRICDASPTTAAFESYGKSIITQTGSFDILFAGTHSPSH